MKKKNKIKFRRILRKIKGKRTLFILLPILLFVSLGIIIFLMNRVHRKLSVYREVTFINPDQAIIFWKTDDETLGHVKYGESRYKRKDVELQTTSQEGETHVVFLDNIPREGLYISIHNDSDSFLIFPEILKIQFDEEDLPYE